MRATLDQRGRNRGLVCDIELKQFCGKQYRVQSRLDRMISEPTGEMKHVQATVILEGITCLCARVVRGCPRSDYGLLPRPVARTAEVTFPAITSTIATLSAWHPGVPF